MKSGTRVVLVVYVFSEPHVGAGDGVGVEGRSGDAETPDPLEQLTHIALFC